MMANHRARTSRTMGAWSLALSSCDSSICSRLTGGWWLKNIENIKSQSHSHYKLQNPGKFLPSSRLPSFCKPFPSGKLNHLIRQIDSGKLPQPYPVYFLYFKLILSTKICSICRCYSIFVKHINICLKPTEWDLW